MPYVDIDADVKPWLEIEPSVTKYDSTLTIIRDAVEKSVDEYVEYSFAVTVEAGELLDGNNSDTIVPRNIPIISVEGIFLDVDTLGLGGSEVPADGYHVADGVIRLRSEFTPRGRAIVKVAYTWGYASLPPDVKLAILQSIEAEFRRKGRKSIGVSGRSKKDERESFTGSDSSAWDSKTGLPKEIVSKLNPYRVFEFPQQPMATRNR